MLTGTQPLEPILVWGTPKDLLALFLSLALLLSISPLLCSSRQGKLYPLHEEEAFPQRVEKTTRYEGDKISTIQSPKSFQTPLYVPFPPNHHHHQAKALWSHTSGTGGGGTSLRGEGSLWLPPC